jgi:methylenetetrahydrofolate dehydrogenase (NADP+)/methenyltetrahydrofolate cyclohydrolase
VAQLLDGRAAAAVMKKELAGEVAEMARPPHLVTVLVGEDPPSVTYVRLKHKDCAEIGIRSTPIEMPATSTQAEVLATVDRLNADPDVDGFIVQSPLPAGLDWDEVMARVDPAKDVDGTHPINLGLLMMGAPRYVSATPAGVLELLARYDIPLKGALVGVAGRGPTVGRPLSVLLSLKGTDATVLTCHSRTRDLPGELRRCDVVVAAMGQPHMITGDYIKPGAVVVDVGQGVGPDGKLVGDVDRPSVDPVAGWVSPTPGGVGPMTRIMLLSNVVKAARDRG